MRSRPPCEGVGRNSRTLREGKDVKVALHVRAWVEIAEVKIGNNTYKVALHVRAWVEIGGRPAQDAQLTMSPSM